jgi:mRNA-degrading endonuclease RelE of RelBE toxin-antitoxin system
MKIVVDKRVYKDAEKIPEYIKRKAAKEMIALKNAVSLSELENVRHMKGTDAPYYRLKFNDYRFMIYYDADTDTAEVLSLTHRKDTYKKQNQPWHK